MVVGIDASAPGRVTRFRPAWRKCMAMAGRPTSTIGAIGLQATNTIGFYKAMLEHVVLPHFTFFGYLSFVVELALGVSLLLGLLTVLSGLGGALWQCNIAIGSYAVPTEWGWIWPLLIAPHLVFAFSRAGRSVGVDLFLYHWLSKDSIGQTGIRRFLRYWV